MRSRILRPYPATVSEYPFLKGMASGGSRLHWWLALLTPVFQLRTASGPATLAELLSPGPSIQFYLEVLYEHPPKTWWKRKKLLMQLIYEDTALDAKDLITCQDYYRSAIERLWGTSACKIQESSPPSTFTNSGVGDPWCGGCNGVMPEGGLKWGTVGRLNIDQPKAGLCCFDALRVMEIERLLLEEQREHQSKRRWGIKPKEENTVRAEWGLTGYPLRKYYTLDKKIRKTIALCLDTKLM